MGAGVVLVWFWCGGGGTGVNWCWRFLRFRWDERVRARVSLSPLPFRRLCQHLADPRAIATPNYAISCCRLSASNPSLAATLLL